MCDEGEAKYQQFYVLVQFTRMMKDFPESWERIGVFECLVSEDVRCNFLPELEFYFLLCNNFQSFVSGERRSR